VVLLQDAFCSCTMHSGVFEQNYGAANSETDAKAGRYACVLYVRIAPVERWGSFSDHLLAVIKNNIQHHCVIPMCT